MPATRTNRILIGAAAAVGVLAGAAGLAAAVTGSDGTAPEPTVARAAAERTALAEVPGSVTGSELDLDDGEWDVDVTAADGSRHEVGVDATTGEVVARESDDADDDRGDDDGDPSLAADAAVTQAEAEAAARATAPGTIHQVTIEREDGRVVWDVEVDGDDGARHDVQVDAETGDIVEHDVDD